MGCCGSGGPQAPITKWKLTTPDGKERIYLTRTEAVQWAAIHGGGTITEAR